MIVAESHVSKVRMAQAGPRGGWTYFHTEIMLSLLICGLRSVSNAHTALRLLGTIILNIPVQAECLRHDVAF